MILMRCFCASAPRDFHAAVIAVQPGDYVLVHVGFALNTLDEAEAKRVFEYLDEMKQLDELQVPSP